MKVSDEMVERYKSGARTMTEYSAGNDVIRAGIEAALSGEPIVVTTPDVVEAITHCAVAARERGAECCVEHSRTVFDWLAGARAAVTA